MKRTIKLLKRIMIGILILLVLTVVAGYFYMRQDKFGAVPTGGRLALVEKSPNYKNGKFQNRTAMPTLAKGHSIVGEVWKTLTKKFPRTEPLNEIPSVKTDLKRLPKDKNWLVWFGHSSFLMQVSGTTFLVDPVFSGSASPIPRSVKAYRGTDVFAVEDMPEIDYLLISHDHYDHLDYETILKLRPKVNNVICGLGVGAHFEHWGYSSHKIFDKDWGEEVKINDSISIITERTHHNCARGFIRDKALWVSFIVKTPDLQIYYSGDGGYDDRFTEIYNKYGAMDWAIMEFGQYNPVWESVHNLPEQVIRATGELHAKNMMPVHHSKFTLARHPWDEPLKKASILSQGKSHRLATPMIGEVLWLDDNGQVFKQWWTGLE